MSVAELEHALQASWSKDQLAVYADALQARGHPRGELIALELFFDSHPRTAELQRHHDALLDAWLGPALCGRPWNARDVRFGFVDDFYVTADTRFVETDYLNALFASPAGPYVRGLTIASADGAGLARALSCLAAREREWLERLSISVVKPRQLAVAEIRALIAATPRLQTLALRGGNNHTFERFDHPALRTLELRGHTVWKPQPMPQVTAVTLVMKPDFAGPKPAKLIELLTAKRFPAVRRLDLAGNEPTYPTSHPDNLGVFPLLRELELLDRLTHLRIPSLRGEAHATALREVVARMPALVELEVARGYTRFPHPVLDPRIRLPALHPWHCTRSSPP